MVDPNHPRISIVRQCHLVSIARLSFYDAGTGESPLTLRLMRLLGVYALYPRPRTSQPHPAHRIYSSLLRDLPITRPNHVWCTDVTDIPPCGGNFCAWPP